MQEAGELAKNTSILMNVSEFDDVGKATDTLISSLQAFKKEGQDVGTFSMQIIDKYNEVGNNYAISTSDLADSLTRSSAALVAANNSLEQSIAMTAAANTTIQDPESVGNALKTVSMRIRGVKTELEEAGEDTEGMVENTAKLQEKIMALTNIDGSGGVDILTRSGDFKSTYDILLEISKVWKEMDDVSQAALLELVAGKTRGSVVAALFQNGDVLEKAYNSAVSASGSAMNELNTHLDSIQGRIDLFNNAVQTMWMSLISSDLAKGVVDLGTMLVKAFDTVLGKLTAVGAAIAGMKWNHNLKKDGKTFLDFIFDIGPEKVKNSSVVKDFNKVFKSVGSEVLEDSMSGVGAIDMLAELANFDDTADILQDIAGAFDLDDDNVFEKIFSKDQIKEVLDGFDDISDETKEAILGMDLFSKSQDKAAVGAKGLVAKIAEFATLHPIITGLTAAVVALGAALLIYDLATVSHEEYIEKLGEETDALQSVQSELQSVQSELDATKSRIDELNAKGTLSFVEEEELARLKEQTRELERQEAILMSQEKRARSKQIETALKAAESDLTLQAPKTPSASSTMSTTSYAASQQQNAYSTGTAYAAALQNPAYQTQHNNQEFKDAYESNLKLLQDAKAELEAAQHTFLTTSYTAEDAEYQQLKKQLESAQDRVNRYNDAIDSMNEAWQTKYGEVGYVENATSEAEKRWNEFYRQHQDYLDQQAQINGVYGKATILDRIFGVTGTDVAKAFKAEFENGVKDGGDTAEVIEGLLYNADYSSAFTGLETQFGITMDNIKDYFTQTGEFAIDYDFDITKYTKYISAHSAAITEYQEAIQKLGKGSFTMDDFMALIEKYPDLAKGVDISSNAFYGLSRNLNRAIKSRTKDFVKDLQKLKESMKAAGKETESIDQLITAIENMPADALDDITQKYTTLADEMERAKTANDRLLASMEENPNEGYENRGQALEYMKEAMKLGEIGSESNLWNVAKEYGFTGYDPSDINASADALANFIAVRDRWWKSEDDGDNRTNDGYSYEGTENFIKDVEQAIQSEEFKRVMSSQGYEDVHFKWDYDETTGALEFDFDNADWDSIVTALSKTKELAGLTSEEFADLLVQVGQYFNIKWENADDVSDYLTKISEGSGTAADKIELMTDSVETYVEKALGKDIDFSNLTREGIEQLEITDEKIKDLLESYLSFKDELEDPLGVKNTIETTGSIASLVGKTELKGSITQGDFGYNFVNTDTFTEALREAEYTDEAIKGLIDTIKEYNNVITVTNDDPLGLNSQYKSTAAVISSLNLLGIEYETIKGAMGAPIGINITATDLITELQNKGWTPDQIRSYLQTLTSEANGLGIQVDGEVNLDPAKINAMIETANATAQGTATFTPDFTKVTEATVPTLPGVVAYDADFTNVDLKDAPIKYGQIVYDDKPIAENANGNFHISGGAFANGTVGAPKTETSLVGELGPELLVRGNRWTTVGENGAEFTHVKKGDIIFNHKQTEQLIKNGYVTGRGRLQGGDSAFASGTAFVSGGGYFGRYEFDGNGGWTEYDVNNKVVDSMNGTASALSKAADALSDASDEFSEVFDWIEVRIEELDETLGLLESQIENAIHYTDKNAIIDDLISTNKIKLENLEAGYNKYAEYAAELLMKVPKKYRDAVKNGAIEIEAFVGEADEKTLEAIQNYREWTQKSADFKQQANEIITEIQSLAKQAFDNIVDEFENKLSINDSKIDRFDAHNSLFETDKGFESENIYQAMIEENESKLQILAQQRDAMQAELDTGKIQKDTDAWYEAVNAIAEADTEIVNLQVEIEDLQDSINELHWEKFEVLMKQFEAVADEAENLLDILNQDDAVDELGNWTDKGTTSLGLLAQKMEVAEMQAQQYKEEIEYLNKNWEKLGYTQEEYIDKLEELKSGQYDSIKAYHDAKDAIVDLNKERVDAIKDGIEKELEAYEELIDKKKEALDADKDAHDWQKSVAEQQKNISDIERQIAALSADDSISARAKRAQLEAELLEAKAEMDEMYYDRTVEKQKEALDKELENFQEKKEDEIEDWEKYLENVELVVADSLAMVQENTRVVLETLTMMGEQFGLTITEALTNPWKAGEAAIQDYGVVLNMSLTQLADLFGMTVDEFAAKLDLTTEGLVSKLDITVAEMAASLGLTEAQLAEKLGLTTSSLSGKMSMTIQQFATSIGYTLPQLAQKLGTTTSGLVGNLNMTMTQFAGRLGLTVDQLAGKFGLTTKGLANKLGQTYKQLTNPFGLSMSSTVDALKKLEKEYQQILNNIATESIKTVSQVNHAMQQYQTPTSKTSSTSNSTTSKPKTVTIGSKINASGATIYDDSYGGGADTQYYAKDPIYIVIGENNGYWLVRHHKLSSGYSGWFKKSDVRAYAKGTKGVKEDQLALIDELGEELQLVPGKNGRLEYLKKGTSVIPADLTENLMEWGKLDPSVMLDQNRPQIGLSPSVVNNTTEIHVDASVGELIHVEHLDGNNPAEVAKIVDKAWDKRMKELNGFIRKYSR